MAKHKDTRVFNISVVGLSGTEKEKGSAGVGKSCLCNRFVRSKEDDFYDVHTSLISQSDFGGRVVNNDHFLYWGEVKKLDEGWEYSFRVVEQTEFIDDATFQPHRSTNLQPYVKRAAATKLSSAEKLMYICTDQLGIEQDFEQKQMPDGKLNIDGFLLCCDVSQVQNRPIDNQLEFLSSLYKQLAKTKKPILLVATKCDIMHDHCVRELQAFLTKGKISIPLIETSASENVNVELAFIALAQIIDKSRVKPKIIPYADAARQQKEIVDAATEKFKQLLVRCVNDFHAQWLFESRRMCDVKDYQNYINLKGCKNAKDLFKKHLVRLKDNFVLRKKAEYLANLSRDLEILVPALEEIEHLTWDEVQILVKEKKLDFGTYFIVLSERWEDSKHIENQEDLRIPYDFLQEKEAETVFNDHVKKLQALRWKAEMKVQFKTILGKSYIVEPGKPWEEVSGLLKDEEPYQHLSEIDKIEIYAKHQQEITEKAKDDFLEMLMEHSDLFVDLDVNAAPSHEKMAAIHNEIKEEARYKALQKLQAERQALLYKRIGFVYHPTIETCPCGQTCMDIQIQELLAKRPPQPLSRPKSCCISDSGGMDRLNIVLLGKGKLAGELADEIKGQLKEDEYVLDDKTYELRLKMVEGDMKKALNSLKTDGFKPHGCLCVFNSFDTMHYIEDCLRSQYTSRKENSNLPVVLLMANEKKQSSVMQKTLKIQGKELANKLQCPFVDSPTEGNAFNCKFHAQNIKKALGEFLEARTVRPSVINPSPSIKDMSEVDLKVVMCVMCGDAIDPARVLAPFLDSPLCSIGKSGENHTMLLDLIFGSQRRRVEVTAISYHSAFLRREELVHGHILVYSANRKASLAMLRAFLSNVPDVIPIYILAITNTDFDFLDDVTKELVMEGDEIAGDITAKFETVSHFENQTEMFKQFFSSVCSRKSQIEESMTLWDMSEGEQVGSSSFDLTSVSSSTFGLADDGETAPAISERSHGNVTESQSMPHLGKDQLFSNFPAFSSPRIGYEDAAAKGYTVGPVVPTKPKLMPKPDPVELNRKVEEMRISREMTKRPMRKSFDDIDREDYSDPIDAISKYRPVSDFIYILPQDNKQGKTRGQLVASSSMDNGMDVFPPDGKGTIVRKPVPYKQRSERLKPRRTAPPEVIVSPANGSDEDPDVHIPSPARQSRRWNRIKSGDDEKRSMRRRKTRKPEGKNYFGHPLTEVAQSPDNLVPLFVEKCITFIEERGLTMEGVYRVSGSKVEQDNLQRTFDADQSIIFDNMDLNVNAVAGALKAFFNELPGPLIPYDIHQGLIEAITIPDKTTKLLSLRGKLKKLPAANMAVLKYVATHLHAVSQNSSLNKMTSENLSICFWPTLMRPDFTVVDPVMATRVYKQILETFIHQCPFMFHNQEEVVDAPSPAPSSPAAISITAGGSMSDSQQGGDLMDSEIIAL